jgi:hypothetical protein
MVAEQLNIYDDFAEFIASLSPEKILAYHAPAKIQKRVEYLVERKRKEPSALPNCRNLKNTSCSNTSSDWRKPAH